MESALKYFAEWKDPRVERTREHVLEEILRMVLAALELSGTVKTIDAMGCQRTIAEMIVDKKADYILAVKENQGHLLEEIKDSFQMLAADAVQTEIDCAHGRVERRRCSVIADLSLIEKAAEWASLQGLVRIESERYHKVADKTERETR